MREIVLDTETTGFEPTEGHRIVEIGAVELFNHLPTGRTFHQYINPERTMPKEAFDVHGIGDEQLRDKPVFSAIGQGFLDFIGPAQLVIHNASFDMKFLNYELARAGLATIPAGQATDTLLIARQKYPGSPASLDALCRRFGVDNSMREKHGALLDSEILAEVYLELIGGRQPGLSLPERVREPGLSIDRPETWRPRARTIPLPSLLQDSERDAHDAFVVSLGESAIWRLRG